jgi:hypothetical protein
MLYRGETVEELITATQRLQESSKLFDDETEKVAATTPLRRLLIHAREGMYWMFPCWPPIKNLFHRVCRRSLSSPQAHPVTRTPSLK